MRAVVIVISASNRVKVDEIPRKAPVRRSSLLGILVSPSTQ